MQFCPSFLLVHELIVRKTETKSGREITRPASQSFRDSRLSLRFGHKLETLFECLLSLLSFLSIAADHWRSRKSRVIPAIPIVVWLEQKQNPLS